MSTPGAPGAYSAVWQVSDSASDPRNYSFYTNIAPVVPEAKFGSVVATFNADNVPPTAVLSQTITTVAGNFYTTSFFYGNYNENAAPSTQAIRAQAFDASPANTLLGGITLNITAPQYAGGGTAEIFGSLARSYSFTAVSAATRISFTDFSASATGASDGLLDNVTVVDNTALALAVPEIDPASATLPLAMFVGTLLMLTDRRRQRA